MKYKAGDVLTNGATILTIKGILFECTYLAIKSGYIPTLWTQEEFDRCKYKLKI